jgi:hypothetical protein
VASYVGHDGKWREMVQQGGYTAAELRLLADQLDVEEHRAKNKAPRGLFKGTPNWGGKFKATGEFRCPRKGEWYLSGAKIQAWLAPNDLSTAYWIADVVPQT